MQAKRPKISDRKISDQQIIDQEILDHLETFLLSLQQGFASLGKHYPITIEGQASKIDLLMYHVKLRCYVVIERLAPGSDMLDIHPMSLLLPAVDRLLCHPYDEISLGLIICQTENAFSAAYVFENIFKSSEATSAADAYHSQIVLSLPEALKEHLPPVKKIEEELSKALERRRPHESPS